MNFNILLVLKTILILNLIPIGIHFSINSGMYGKYVNSFVAVFIISVLMKLDLIFIGLKNILLNNTFFQEQDQYLFLQVL